MSVHTEPAEPVVGAPAPGQAYAAEDRQRPPRSAVASEATRYLCAAVHLDGLGALGRGARRLRERIRERLLEDPVHAVGVSPGVDLRPVVLNCREAQRRLLLRDVVLTAIVLGTLVLSALLEPAGVVLVVGLLLCVEVVYAEAVYARSLVGRRFLRGAFDPVRELGATRGPDPVLAHIAEAQDGNVTVYSGFSPFVGAGFDHGGWSFALDLSRGAERFGTRRDPKPVALPGLYAFVSDRVAALGIPGLSLEDRLYVDGRSLRLDDRFLAGERPIASASPALVAEYVGGGAESVRHYKAIRVVTWGGDLVLSIFLRFSIVQKSLFAEASYFLLPPLQGSFHRIDELYAQVSWGERGRLALTSGCIAPLRAIAAPFGVADAAIAPVRRSFRRRRMMRGARRNAAFDYGTYGGIREEVQSGDYRQYFQKLDRELFAKVIERSLFDAIVAFLDEHDVDVRDLEQRETTILNNGVIVSGGSIHAESLAVGNRARALAGRLAPSRGKPPTSGAGPSQKG
jgi:hypothetical protein